MRSFLDGAQLAVQTLINRIFQARDRSVQAEQEATQKAASAASSASQSETARNQSRQWAEGSAVIGLPDATPESKSSKLHAQDSRQWAEAESVTTLPGATPTSRSSRRWSSVSRDWAEGTDVTTLPGATPQSKSSKKWSEDSRLFRDHAHGWAEGTDVTGLPGATMLSKSSKKWSEDSKLFRDEARTARDEAAALVGRAPGSVFAQRVLATPPIHDWYDLLLSPPSPALVLDHSPNCSYDANDHAIAVQMGNVDTWHFSARFDVTLDPAKNPLYGAKRISYRLADLVGKLADIGGPGEVDVQLNLFNSSMALVRQVPLGPWRGAGGEAIYEASNVEIASPVRYVALAFSAQGGEGYFPIGHLSPGPFLASGYLSEEAAATTYQRRSRVRMERELPYALVAFDARLDAIRLTGGGALTLPSNASLVGAEILLLNATNAGVSLLGAAGVTVRSASGALTLRPGGTARVVCYSPTEWFASGDLG